MNQSKISLKEYVRVVNRNIEYKKQLQEQLLYLDSKVGSCSSPVYDRIGGTSSIKGDRLLLILEKIDKVKRKILKIEKQKEYLNSFICILTDREKELFNYYFIELVGASNITRLMNVTRTRVYQYLDSINEKWLMF